MKHRHALTVSQLLTHASITLPVDKALGYAYLQSALNTLPNVSDPIDFLLLNARAESLVRTYCLPEPGL